MRGLCFSFTSLCFLFLVSKKFEDWGGGGGRLKNFRTGRVIYLGDVIFAGGSVPHYMP